MVNRFRFQVETRNRGDAKVGEKGFIVRLPQEMWEYLTEELPDGQWRGVGLHFDWDWWDEAAECLHDDRILQESQHYECPDCGDCVGRAFETYRKDGE